METADRDAAREQQQQENAGDAPQEQPTALDPQLSPSSPSSESGASTPAAPANPYLASPSTMLGAKRKPQSEPLVYGFQPDDDRSDVRRDYHEYFQKVLDGETSTHSGLSNSSAASTTSFQQQQQQQIHAPHLQNHNIASQSINSEDDSTDFAHVTYGELAQPRPEIVLRWKRFGVLVVIAFGAIAGATALLVTGFELTDEQNADAAERKVDKINAYSGIVMGFFESFLGLLLGNLLPVYLVYLHNLKWFPGDNPAIKSSKFKKVALMLFIPLVMVALGNSFSAVQANQRSDSTSRRRMQALHLHMQPSAYPGRRLLMLEQQQSANDTNAAVLPLEETILRSAVTRQIVAAPQITSTCSKADAEAGKQRELLNALPSAMFGFPMKSWQRELYPDPASYTSTKRIRLEDSVETGDVLSYTTAVELLDLGLSQFKRSLGGMRDVGMEPRWNDDHPTSTSALLSEILSEFRKLNLSALDADALTSIIERSVVSSLIQMETLTIEVPLKSDDNEPSSLVCGAQSCVFLELAEADDRFSVPRKQIAMMQYLHNCTAVGDESCQIAPNAAFVYGFTSTAYAETQKSRAKRSLVFSFGKLSWQFDDFLHICGSKTAGTSDKSADCRVLHHKLSPSGRHIVVGANSVPSAPNFANPARLIQLIERKPVVEAVTNSLQVINAIGSQQNNCSSAVDTYVQFVTKNHLFLGEHLVQLMYTAAVFYLFQHGAVVDAAETAEIAVSRRLQDGTTSDSVKVYLSNTNIGQISMWMGCGVILILSILVILLPNERARLEPPKGGNARAERFIAVQTEESYPNLVYKKRFLIGKTGEEIKFGEFAVESVGLHHKMEEDEQIYL